MSARLRELDDVLSALPRGMAGQINDLLLSKSYLDGETESAGYPRVFQLETTNRCAMRCRHCPRTWLMTRAAADMDLALFKRTLAQVRAYANHEAIYLMHFGEPSLYPRFGESIRLAQARGLRVTISSAASALSDTAVREAVDSGLRELWLIFDGMDDETLRRIRGPGASFARSIGQLRKLLNYRGQRGACLPHVTAAMLKHPHNRHQWELFRKHFSRVAGISCRLMHFSSFAGDAPQLERFRRSLLDDASEAREARRVARLDRRVCFYPWQCVTILCDGRVVPCCRDVDGAYVLGDLRRQSLLDIWNGEPLRRLRRAFLAGDRDNPLCRRCQEGSLGIGTPDNRMLRAARELCASGAPPKDGRGRMNRAYAVLWQSLPRPARALLGARLSERTPAE